MRNGKIEERFREPFPSWDSFPLPFSDVTDDGDPLTEIVRCGKIIDDLISKEQGETMSYSDNF